jgi:hypothetical protein
LGAGHRHHHEHHSRHHQKHHHGHSRAHAEHDEQQHDAIDHVIVQDLNELQ